jgi:hypothetical protein
MYYINSSLLSYLLTGKYPADSNLIKNIINGVEGLGKKQVISISQSDINNEWIIDTEDMIKNKVDKPKPAENNDKDNKKVKPEFYVAIDNEEINKILNSSKKYYTRSISLLRFFVYLLTTLSKKKDSKYNGIGIVSITDMVEATGLNNKTVTSYLNSLVEYELIYRYKSKDFIKFEDGDIVEISHTYGRFKDKDKIDKIGKQHEEDYGEKLKTKHQKINKSKSDKTRGLSQMYKHVENCIKEGKPIPYDNKKCKEIYIAMCDLNIKNNKEHPERLKDLSIFKQFDFYKGEYITYE